MTISMISFDLLLCNIFLLILLIGGILLAKVNLKLLKQTKSIRILIRNEQKKLKNDRLKKLFKINN